MIEHESAAVPDPWRRRAAELADWADRLLVNRRDIYGGQYVKADGAVQRTTHRQLLTPSRLDRHFAAETNMDVIGLHATAPNETCRWVAVDIDAHDGQEACVEANLRFAREVRMRAWRAGLDVRLLDTSGGRGGFHLWIVLDGPIPMALARRLVCWLARDPAGFGLKRPDLFPGNHELTGKRCGNWLRLPGRHHKRPSWTTVWSPKRRAWRAGDEAIDALLSLRGKPVDVAGIVPDDSCGMGPKRLVRTMPVPIRSPGFASRMASPLDETAGRPSSGRRGHSGTEDLDLPRARAALEYYRNDDLDYNDWLAIGMALRNLADEEAAFALWDEWSLQSGKYDEETTATKWASLRPADKGGGIGLGTLFRHAMDAGWPGPSFEISHGRAGERRITHRSRRRGIIIVPGHALKGTRQQG